MYYPEVRYDIDYDRSRQRWNGWGAEDQDLILQDRLPRIFDFLAKELGVSPLPETPSVALEEIRLPESRLVQRDIRELEKIVGQANVKTDHRERVLHSFGQSFADIIRLRTNMARAFTDAVVYPGDERELTRILELCTRRKIATIAFGGGSSVVGGLEALCHSSHSGVVTIDLFRLSGLIELNEEARCATFHAGTYGPVLERELNARGYTLGHFPQSFEYSTIGGWVAARSAGQQSNRYGKIEKILTSLRMVTPAGLMETLRVPAAATGPDWNQIVAGSEGLLGIITRVTVKVHPLPEARCYFALVFPDFEKARGFLKSATGAGHGLSMIRLSDSTETRLYETLASLAHSGLSGAAKAALQASVLRVFGQPAGQRCLVTAGFDGDRDRIDRESISLRSLMRRFDGFYAGQRAGENWLRTRFNMPFLRNHVVERGIGIDTMETATTYDRVESLHEAVLSEVARVAGPSTVMCHLSHSYHEGACLYFTVIYLMDQRDPLAQWRRIKSAASEAIVANGGNISHHHGVGLDHKPYYERQTGELALSGLRAMKRELDPRGILNPSKLFG